MLLSTQVVQEFIVAALRKLQLPPQQVREVALTMLDSPLVVIEAPHMACRARQGLPSIRFRSRMR